MDPESCAAWIAINDLLGRYPHAVDSGAPGDVAALFGDRGVLIVHGGREFVGGDAIRTFLTESVASRHGTNFRIRHHVSSLVIKFDGADRATTRSYFLAVGAQDGPDHWGRYDDVVVRAGAGWVFDTRRVTIEGASPSGWIGSGAGPVELG